MIKIQQYVRQLEPGEVDGPRGPWSIREEEEALESERVTQLVRTENKNKS